MEKDRVNLMELWSDVYPKLTAHESDQLRRGAIELEDLREAAEKAARDIEEELA